MLTIHGVGGKLCDGVSRREILCAGGLSLFGLSSGGLHSFTRSAGASDTASHRGGPGEDGSRRAKHCILLFLMGGPPQHSTWDPKPNAPSDVRGEFAPRPTSVPGTHFCELLPGMAQLADRMAILRAVTTGDNAHSSSGYAMLTGRPHQPLNRENANPGAPNDWPTMGAVIQHFAAPVQNLPASIRLPHPIFNTDRSIWPGQTSGWLGAQADPWLLRCSPASERSAAADFQLQASISSDRFVGRRSLLTQLEAGFQTLERNRIYESFDRRQQQAFNLLGRPESLRAFDLERESDDTRNRYGNNQFGQSVLMARRLVEAGVSMVQVNWFRGPDEPPENPCWDSHVDEAPRLRNVLLPTLDQAYHALLTDLVDRGLLDETLVICMGEFGRSPKINDRGGRDHWGGVFSLALAGGGVRGGVVHGESDRDGGLPRSGAVHPSDLSATIFHLMGLDPALPVRDPLGRVFPISTGQVIEPILA